MTTFVIRRMSALGDVIWSTPVAQRVRAENPDARIIIETNFPLAYKRHPANVEINSPRPLHYRLLDLDMAYETRPGMHGIDAYFEVAFGDQHGDKTVSLYREALPELGIDWQRAIVLHPNVSWRNRTIRQSWWCELSRRIISRGFLPVVLGTEIDHDLSESGAFDTRSKLTLHQQISAIAAARLLICGDSMLFTLVGATETPAIGFCTITRAEHMLPYRHGVIGWNFAAISAAVPCYGCRATSEPTTHLLCRLATDKCVETFEIEDVLTTLDALLFA
jgi:ADP-heptose:LPS heptosyltransferase